MLSVLGLICLWLCPVWALSCFQPIRLGLFPVGTLSSFFNSDCWGSFCWDSFLFCISDCWYSFLLVLFHDRTLSCFPTNAAGTLSVGTPYGGTLSVLTASVGTLSCWGSFRSDSFHHPFFNNPGHLISHLWSLELWKLWSYRLSRSCTELY